MDDDGVRKFMFSISEYDISKFPRAIDLFANGGRGKYRFMLAVMENYLNSLNVIPKNKMEYEIYVKELTGQPLEKPKRKIHPNSLENLMSYKRKRIVVKCHSKDADETLDSVINTPKVSSTTEGSADAYPKKPLNGEGSDANLGDISKALGIDLSGFGL